MHATDLYHVRYLSHLYNTYLCTFTTNKAERLCISKKVTHTLELEVIDNA